MKNDGKNHGEDRVNTTLRRVPERCSKDFDLACEIIDAAKICHVGIVDDGRP